MTIDAMVIYTAAVFNNNGGSNGVNALVNLALADANPVRWRQLCLHNARIAKRE